MTVDKDITILLVEDSGSTRKMEMMIIKKLGFTNILEAEDGNYAVEFLSSDRKIDLVISDWNMPNMDGFSLLKWVRAHQRHGKLPFIMATGQGQKKDAVLLRETGVSGIVPKPFTADDLSDLIENIFEHGAVQESDTIAERVPNVLPNGKVIFNIAHIQITDHLVLGALRYLIENGDLEPKHFELKTMCESGWNPVAQKLENGEIDAAFVLAPIAMDLYGYGVPINLVMLAHKNGSIMVRNKQTGLGTGKEAFQDKVFYIPHQLSVHHMLSHMYLSELGLNPGVAGEEGVNVSFEVVPPIKMPEFIAGNSKVAGFMVAEPLGTKAIAANSAELQFLSAEAWKNHPCCVVTFRREIIEQHPEAVQEFTNLLVQAGKFISRRPGTAAEMAVNFLDPSGTLGLSSTVLKNVLTEPQGITTDDLYPVVTELKRMNEYMANEMGIGQVIDVADFVESRFADVACKGAIPAKLAESSLELGTIVNKVQTARSGDSMAKVMLDKEGKYLLFSVDQEVYGLGIKKMREIIGLRDIHTMPNKPVWFRGIINLRDKIVPVLDLKTWFGYGETELHDRTSIIVVETEGKTNSEHLGIVVDSVAEIVDISANDVESAPSFGPNTQYILAMAKINNKVNILLDVDSVVNSAAAGYV